MDMLTRDLSTPALSAIASMSTASLFRASVRLKPENVMSPVTTGAAVGLVGATVGRGTGETVGNGVGGGAVEAEAWAPAPPWAAKSSRPRRGVLDGAGVSSTGAGVGRGVGSATGEPANPEVRYPCCRALTATGVV